MLTQWDEMMFRRFADPLIAFANLPGIGHVDDVHRLFAPAIVSSQAVLAGQPLMQVLSPGDEAAFESDRKRVRGWLDVLARKSSARARAQVQKDIESIMTRTIELRGSARFADGVLSYSITPILTGVEGVIGFAGAMLADESRNQSKRLGRCQLRECGRYFLRQPGDWRQKFCQPAHGMKSRDMKRPLRPRTPKEATR